ncbi:MAG TPA: sigma-70 family RNA polymerase sigma factor [Flavobacterium sp.]|jgi:RNA polymerase sigma-70 factor (ECF subfamily)
MQIVCSLEGVCEEDIFATIFRDHAKALRNYLFYKFGNEEKANDASQEAFIKLWENCSKVEPAQARSYLYTVANNASLNKIAHEKVVLAYVKESSPVQYTSESPEFILEESEFKNKLQKAISNLPEAQRTAFLMHRIDGKKYSEIAEALSVSVKTIEKRISGALVSLRKEIENIR